MIEQLFDRLNDSLTVTHHTGNRIYYSHLPTQTARPCLLVSLISDTYTSTTTRNSNIARARIQVDAIATTPKQTFDLAKQVFRCLQGYRGGDIVLVTLDNQLDSSLPPSDASNEWEYRRIQDYEVCYRVNLDTSYTHSATGGVGLSGQAITQVE